MYLKRSIMSNNRYLVERDLKMIDLCQKCTTMEYLLSCICYLLDGNSLKSQHRRTSSIRSMIHIPPADQRHPPAGGGHDAHQPGDVALPLIKRLLQRLLLQLLHTLGVDGELGHVVQVLDQRKLKYA